MRSAVLRILNPLRAGFRMRKQATSTSLNLFCGKYRTSKSEMSLRLFSESSYIIKSGFPKIEMSDLTLHDFVFERCVHCPEKVAAECMATGKVFKYGDILRQTKNIAVALQKKFKLKKGDHQAIILPNCPEYPCIFMGGSMAGIVSSTFNPLYTPTEMSHQLSLIRPKIIFTIRDFYAKCLEALELAKHTAPIVVVKLVRYLPNPRGAVAYSELSETSGDLEPVNIDLNDDVVIPFSSGTSGLPKGVQLTHRNLTSNLFQLQSSTRLKENPNEETNQVSILGILPMFHIYGMVAITLDGLRCATRLVILPRFDPKLFIKTMCQNKVEVMYMAPPLVSFIANSNHVTPECLKNVQFVVNGAAPVPSTDINRLIKKAPNLIYCQGYGMTETSPVITFTHYNRYKKITSIGHPTYLTEVKVVDVETRKALPKGTPGEICVRGPQVMKGYFKNPEETKNTFEDGWLKTGDIGLYDEDGDFYIVDRLKELIKVKGFQVAPAELEDTLKGHPAVADVGVIGVPHPTQGQAPKAYVVVRKGVSVTETEIMDFVREKLSSFKHLNGGVRFIKEIPKSNAGKILRKELKAMSEKEDK